MSKTIDLILATPRGFCAGVDRAVQIVERALVQYGAPVYIRHEIVHNRRVVERLQGLGAIFVDELEPIPEGSRVIFSAHGVAQSVPQEAKARGLHWLDATCPLVSKVHIEAARHFEAGRHIFLIGHAGHPEVIGTMGQVPPNAMSLIETLADAEAITAPDMPLAYITQTTLSVDDTAAIIAVLQRRFPAIAAPHKEDICYATTNRQTAVRALAEVADMILVIGAQNSSNSQRLVEVALDSDCPAHLIADAGDIDWQMISAYDKIGLTAGASAPEEIVDEVVASFKQHTQVRIIAMEGMRERVTFKLPLELRDV